MFLLPFVRSSASDPRPGGGARMHVELGEHTLGMMPGGVGADLQLLCDLEVGPTLCEECCDLGLAAGQAISVHEGDTWILLSIRTRLKNRRSLAPKLAPQFSHFVQRAADLIDEEVLVAAEH
jgi:hypothetical protein